MSKTGSQIYQYPAPSCLKTSAFYKRFQKCLSLVSTQVGHAKCCQRSAGGIIAQNLHSVVANLYFSIAFHRFIYCRALPEEVEYSRELLSCGWCTFCSPFVHGNCPHSKYDVAGRKLDAEEISAQVFAQP